MNTLLHRFLHDSSGATVLEYALVLALVCLMPMAALGMAGDALAGLVGQAAAQLASGGATSGIDVLP